MGCFWGLERRLGPLRAGLVCGGIFGKRWRVDLCTALLPQHGAQVSIFRSIEVSIPACHAGDPGAIPGGRDFCDFFPTEKADRQRLQNVRAAGIEPAISHV